MAYRLAIPAFSWHFADAHVFGMFFAKTGDVGSVIFVILCSPWQSVQTGESAIPPRIPLPCTLFSYFSRMPGWHLPQSVGMFCRCVADRGWSPGRMAWLPWQSGQTAVPINPDFLRAMPWTLASYAAITCWSGSLYFSSMTRSLWHFRHTDTMFMRNV